MVHRLSRAEARRVAVSAQLLGAPRPTDLGAVVAHLAAVQVDLTAAVAPSADLVLWGRLGAAYQPEHLDALLGDGILVELRGFLRPAADIALFRADMEGWPGPEPLRDWQIHHREWVQANDLGRRDILAALRSDGPLPSRELPDTTVVPWRSSGWTNDRSRRQLLELMAQRGEVAIAGREGRDILWDLAERVYPDDPPVPAKEATAARDARRLAALGIARPRAPECPGEPNDVGEAGEPAVVDGVRGTWRVDPGRLGQDGADRVVLLSPLDRLVIDRRRMADLFEFDYQLEMYKPAAARRWGYWAMPVLVGDRLVGKLDATADHEAGLLRVSAVHLDVELPSAARRAVDDEIDALAGWLRLRPTRVTAPGGSPRRSRRR